MEDIKKKMGEKINFLRNRAGLSQQELAKILGSTQRSISHWEGGKNQIPYEVLLQICQYFNVDPNYFLFPGPEKESQLEERLRELEQKVEKLQAAIAN